MPRLAVDLAIELRPPEALVTIDAVVRSGTDAGQLLASLRARGPVRHCRRAAETLSWADPNSESPLESWGRGELLLEGVPRPECNLEIRCGGREIRPDMLWLPLGIAAEADGRGKYDDGDALCGRSAGRSGWSRRWACWCCASPTPKCVKTLLKSPAGGFGLLSGGLEIHGYGRPGSR